ncbi:unnamed protein product, partial [Laminaria digitata]
AWYRGFPKNIFGQSRAFFLFLAPPPPSVCGQVGEVVMYLPQGHAAYLRIYPENKAPPYKLFKGRPAVVRCQVKEISYAFPTDHKDTDCYSVICHVTLDVLGFPARVSASVTARQSLVLATKGEYPLAYCSDSFGPAAGQGEPAATFSVSLRDSGAAADFLVPEKRYDLSLRRTWKLSERVMMEWKEEKEEDLSG